MHPNELTKFSLYKRLILNLQKHLKQILRFSFFFGLGLLILYWLYRNQQNAYLEDCVSKGIAENDCSLIEKVLNDIRSANYGWILFVLFLFMLSNVVRALRWKMLIRPLGYAPGLINCFLTVMLGYFANLALPRMGEIIRGLSLSRIEKIPFQSLFGTIVTGRITDVLCLLVVILIALIFEMDLIWNFVTENADNNRLFQFEYLVGIFLFGLVLLALFYYFIKKSQNSLVLRVKKVFMGFVDGLKTVGQLENTGLYIFYSLLIWFLYYMMTYFCFYSFQPTAHLGPIEALVTFVFGTLGIVFPSPGGLGSYHFLITEALKIYDVNEADAFSFANLIFFSIQIFCNVLFGILALILLPLINRNRTDQE